MAEAARVYADANEVNVRLAELGLNREVLIDALRQGELQRRLASHLDPPAAPGFNAWSRSTRALRENLGGQGWTPSDRGLSTVVNPDNTMAIAVTTGNESTGQPDMDADASPKYPRGPATVEAVRANNQLELFDSGDYANASESEDSQPQTWFLMFHSTVDGIWAELSCPDGMSADGRVESWSERIVLGRDEGDGDALRASRPDEEPSGEPDVQVVRRNPA
jgi:hypothetical protein